MSRQLALAFALLFLPLEACTNADIYFPDGGLDSGRAIDAGPARPGAGDLVVTELLVSPNGADSEAEYFELHNPSVDVEYDLVDCVIEDHNGPPHTIAPASGTLMIAPGAYITFASFTTALQGGFAPGYTYGAAIQLTNTGGSVTLSCDGVTVDVVMYSSGDVVPGASLSLDPDSLDATANDVVANYCDGVMPYGSAGNLGTPGADNPQCP